MRPRRNFRNDEAEDKSEGWRIGLTVRTANNSTRKQSYSFRKDTISIGSQNGNDIILDSHLVSRFHAQIHLIEDKLILEDLDSINGIFLTELGKVRKVTRARLLPESVFAIGEYIIEIESMRFHTKQSARPMPRSITREIEDELISYRLDSYKPTSLSVRTILGKLFIHDSAFEAFCLDHFPRIRRRKFSAGMDRIAKTNLILEAIDSSEILRILKKFYAEEYSNVEALVDYENMSK